jgi:hypothetical protein
MVVARPQEISYVQAPCRLDGVISRDLQEESKEGTCRCPLVPGGCCVDALGILIPRILKRDYVVNEK